MTDWRVHLIAGAILLALSACTPHPGQRFDPAPLYDTGDRNDVHADPLGQGCRYDEVAEQVACAGGGQ